MGFLKRILRPSTTEHPSTSTGPGSFERLSDEELQVHMGIKTYGSFELTDAIRPSYDVRIPPRQGFRYDKYVDETSGATTPVIMAAVTKSILMDTFFSLIDQLDNVVDVVLETSHHCRSHHEDLYRDHIDVPVLKSILLEFEDVLTDDGCTGIAVISPSRQQEIQLDEHKLLIAYGSPLTGFRETLIAGDVFPDNKIRFVTEAEHVHSSSERMRERFEQLKTRLGVDTAR
ncbi:hypothetical protein [Allorhodopirellula heiligendammensis]|uniref:Uncharacterized protein n=1 Tax=Allorhodopirellula heiligendammensis TaxID=2714739 RepID=A0A5C6C662_9BACT|nr:hypothetical protein [Allorhodopirellula heiligendammensis]TWU18936.1 hypothetical protein Poly21_11070 [Allorhodopirellula heiligendammensis]|tara:strand:+ start:207 stop:896 length:690 start_codon:yes stop_codon:yes gene_type:complete